MLMLVVNHSTPTALVTENLLILLNLTKGEVVVFGH